MRRWRCLLPVSVLLVLVGCASPKQVDLNPSDTFVRQGRFAVLAQQQGKAVEAVQGGFVWREQGSKLQLDLTSSLGSTLARLEVQATGATLIQTDGRSLQAADADDLMQTAIGQPLPVLGLQAWLRGRVLQGLPNNALRDDKGRLSAFTENGWRVEFTRYDTLGPSLLVLKRDQGGQMITVRVIIDQ